MTLNEAYKKASNYIKVHGAILARILDNGNEWIFTCKKEVSDFGFYPNVAINKHTGEMRDFNLLSDEGIHAVENAKQVDISLITEGQHDKL